MNYWLSLDWDFFCATPEKWSSHQEEYPTFREATWTTLDPKKTTVPLDPGKFLNDLALNLRGAKLVVSESHMYAQHTFYQRTPPDRLLHFDAHHDLWDADTPDMFTCGTWLGAVLKEDYPRLRATVCFPQWRGELDLGRRKPMLHRMFKGRVEFRVWPKHEVAPGDVSVVHLCRSSAWSPPWFDYRFEALVAMLEKITHSKALFPYVEQERYHPLTQRFDHGRFTSDGRRG